MFGLVFLFGEIYAYPDAKFAGDVDTSRSTGGSVIYKGQACFGWQSKLQNHVTLSTTEAEHVALNTTARELMWFRALEATHALSLLNATLLFRSE